MNKHLHKQMIVSALLFAFFFFASFAADMFLIVEFTNSRYQEVAVNIGFGPPEWYKGEDDPERFLKGAEGETWEGRSQEVYGRTEYILSKLITESLRLLKNSSGFVFVGLLLLLIFRDFKAGMEEKIKKELTVKIREELIKEMQENNEK